MSPTTCQKPDFYAVLGVSRTATDAELRRAYREQALRHHPDKNPDSVAEATEKFKLVAEAFSVLKDPQSRAAYDQDRGSTAASTFTFEKASDLFSDVFGAEFVGTLGRAARGLASAPGTVLTTAANCCGAVAADIPGVRGAVAAGYESMVADAELQLDLEVRRMGVLDERLDAANSDVQEHMEKVAASEKRRCDLESSSAQKLWSASLLALAIVLGCLGLLFLQAYQPLLLAVVLCGERLFRAIMHCKDHWEVLNRHAEIASAEARTRSELKRAMLAAQESFETQRRRASDARQELARLRGVATEAQQHGPSLKHAVAVSSHLMGQVVGSVFGRRSVNEPEPVHSIS